MIDLAHAQQLIGRSLRTRDGDDIGRIGQVYVDDDHGQPEWITVDTGPFGTQQSFVPLAEAQVSGRDVVVPYTRDQIIKAPGTSDSEYLTEAEEQNLYEHYNLSYSAEGPTFAGTDADTRLRKWEETENVQGRGSGPDRDGAGGRAGR